MSFADLLKADAGTFTGDWGESVVYVKQGGGEKRTIRATIIRQGLGSAPGFSAGQTPTALAHVANDAVTGISLAEYRTGDGLLVDLSLTGKPILMALLKTGTDGQQLADTAMVRWGLR